MLHRARLVLVALMALPVMLGACTMTTPSQVRTGEIQLEKSVQTHSYDLAVMSEAQMRSVAREYERIGRGPMSVTVAYDAVEPNGQQAARRDMDRVLAYLRRHGLTRAQVQYVAAESRAAAGQAVFSYPALVARAPDHCTRMPGYQGAEGLDAIQTYQISCESKDVISKMVANPEDLLGTDGRNAATSRRAGAVVETYQDGEPNENFYDIKSASEVGQ